MNYISLCSALRRNKVLLFKLGDIKNLFPDEKEKTIKNNFIRWVSKGYFYKIRKDLYEFVEQGFNKVVPDFYIANRIYKPSYVSLETALSFYSIIPDVAAGVTSLTTLPTRTFKNKHGVFYYKSCRKKAFTGYRLMMYDGCKVHIADKEKALTDFFYYRVRSGFPFNFEEERFNKRILMKLNWKKVFYYAELFNNKTMKALHACKEDAKC